jgi:transposase-like protein
MPRKHHKAEQIIAKLRQAEVLMGQGKTLEETCRAIEVTTNTYYRWKQQYGGMKIDQAKRYKDLEKENQRLKKLVADQALDISMLKEVARGNF